MTPIIEVAGLKKHFALKRGLFSRSAATVKAVDGVGFTINPGETLCLVGEIRLRQVHGGQTACCA